MFDIHENICSIVKSFKRKVVSIASCKQQGRLLLCSHKETSIYGFFLMQTRPMLNPIQQGVCVLSDPIKVCVVSEKERSFDTTQVYVQKSLIHLYFNTIHRYFFSVSFCEMNFGDSVYCLNQFNMS